MKKINCYSLFDITASGITGNYRSIQYPYTTKTGVVINNDQELTQARNQQRNLDTILQLISMRTQLFDVELPTVIDNCDQFPGHNKVWYFNFSIEDRDQWLIDNDEFWLLKQDSERTPMLVGLTEDAGLNPWVEPDRNIYFCK